MSQVTLKIECSCGHTNARKYSWFDPSIFKTPKDASLTSIFFCEKCVKGQSYKIQYLPNREMKVTEKLVLSTQIKEGNEFYIGGYIDEETEGEEKVEALSEDA